MTPELRWKASLSATCLHVAACRAAGLTATDAPLAAELDVPSKALAGEIFAAGWPLESVLQQLLALAADFENNRELVTRCATRLQLYAGPDRESVGRVAGAIADLEASLLRQKPELVDELAVRGGPLREQWEAWGPGLLRETARLTDAAIAPECAEVVLVAPYVGGQGWAHAAQNRVTLEALLVNPLPALPEVVRLAWLVSQLNSDLPRFADSLPRGGAARAFGLATLPAVLAAAASLELVSGDDEAVVERAIVAWGLGGNAPAEVGQRLWQWWNAWLDRPAASWGVAVAALDHILSAAPLP